MALVITIILSAPFLLPGYRPIAAPRPALGHLMQLGDGPRTRGADYTARSGITRARQLLAPFVEEKDIDEVLKSRFAILNFW